jgi:hypothetical protein
MLQDLKPEMAGYVIMKMRAFEEMDELDSSSHDGFAHDSDEVSLLIDERAHPTDEREVMEAISNLSADEQCELIALAWLGRGDYSPSEWQQALRDARQRWNKRTPAYLIGMTMLADYLEEGLSSLDYDLEEVEYGR